MRKHNLKLLLFICSIASLSGVILGYDASVISGVIEPLTEHLALTPWQSGWAVSNVILGCIVGAGCVGAISDRIGRKPTLVITALLFAVSAVGSALADSLTGFVIYRLVGGLAVGMASAITPLYIAEVSPKDWRGRMLGLQQMLMVGGQVTVYVVNYLIARGMPHAWIVSEGWRWMLASGVVPCLLFLALVPFMPESPRWLALNGKRERALAVLTRLSTPEHARRLLAEISAPDADSVTRQQGTRLLRDARMRYILLIGCAIAILQQVSGINILLYPAVLRTVAAAEHLTGYTDLPLSQHFPRTGAAGRSSVLSERSGSLGTDASAALGSAGLRCQPGDYGLGLYSADRWPAAGRGPGGVRTDFWYVMESGCLATNL